MKVVVALESIICALILIMAVTEFSYWFNNSISTNNFLYNQELSRTIFYDFNMVLEHNASMLQCIKRQNGSCVISLLETFRTVYGLNGISFVAANHTFTSGNVSLPLQQECFFIQSDASSYCISTSG